jgi:hypothetical protein
VCGFRPECAVLSVSFFKDTSSKRRQRSYSNMASNDEIASPSRRSSRKRVPVSYSDNVIKIVEQVKPETRKRRRSPSKQQRTTATRGRPRIQKDESDDDHKKEAKDPEEGEDSSEIAPVKKRKATKKGKAPKKGRGLESRLTCEFCDKVCVSASGLKYHVGK